MKEILTEYQRLNLLNQYKILSELALIREDKHMADEYDRLANIVEEGYVIEYDQLTTVLSEEMPEEDSRFVLNVLDMFLSSIFPTQILKILNLLWKIFDLMVLMVMKKFIIIAIVNIYCLKKIDSVNY